MTQSLNSANIDTEKKTEKYSKPKNVSLMLQIFIVLKGHPGIPGKEEEINHNLFLEDKKRKQQKNQKILFSSPSAKSAGPKGLRGESARAVTGRRCPHSGVG